MTDAKKFNGKAIYCPSGKAGEYAEYACNFYVGCSNGCEYCFLTKGLSAKTYNHRYPKLKAHFHSEQHAIDTFEAELYKNLEELQKHGIFFSFTTDPLLPETRDLTFFALKRAAELGVPVKVLTKCADGALYLADRIVHELSVEERNEIALGFTLTGHDELEKGASTNAERIEAMKKLHTAGFKTFASIEPVVDVESSFNMIFDTAGFCDLYKIGVMSGKKYDKEQLLWLIEKCHGFTKIYAEYDFPIKFYFKDSLLKLACINRESLPANCVGRDYNIFNEK
jgi:DNA repair photolyase